MKFQTQKEHEYHLEDEGLDLSGEVDLGEEVLDLINLTQAGRCC